MGYSKIKFLCHHGIKGQKWGVRRYQNEDGTLTEEGKKRYMQNLETESTILREGSKALKTASELLGDSRGSKRINKKDYSKFSDDDLRKMVNRLSLEKQYGDLTGDNKYVMTGREKTREVLQTTGSILGIAASAVTIAALIQKIKKGN